MKRSEVVKQIAIELLDIFQEDYMSQMGEEWCANLILLRMEELGMQPPNITKMPNTWFRSTGDYGYEAAEWEPEDVE